MAIFTHEQTAGKGQRGRSWTSDAGMNVAMSLILNPSPLRLFQQFQFSACIAVACHRILSNYTGEMASIKWPNDLYWQDRKAGGILIENIVKGEEWQWAVSGIGLNVNQTDFSASINAVSIRQITGKSFDTIAIARELANEMLHCFGQLKMCGPSEMMHTYRRHLYRKNELTKFRSGNRVFEATVIDVTDDGRLVIQHSLREEFTVGEIEWVR